MAPQGSATASAPPASQPPPAAAATARHPAPSVLAATPRAPTQSPPGRIWQCPETMPPSSATSPANPSGAKTRDSDSTQPPRPEKKPARQSAMEYQPAMAARLYTPPPRPAPWCQSHSLCAEAPARAAVRQSETARKRTRLEPNANRHPAATRVSPSNPAGPHNRHPIHQRRAPHRPAQFRRPSRVPPAW